MDQPNGFIAQTGNGGVFEGAISISPDGRTVSLGGGSFWSWLRRRWNAESTRPLTKPHVRVTVEDLEADA